MGVVWVWVHIGRKCWVLECTRVHGMPFMLEMIYIALIYIKLNKLLQTIFEAKLLHIVSHIHGRP